MKRVLLVFAFLYLVSAAFGAEQRFSIPIGDSPQKGPADAPVTIIEFIDFQ